MGKSIIQTNLSITFGEKNEFFLAVPMIKIAHDRFLLWAPWMDELVEIRNLTKKIGWSGGYVFSGLSPCPILGALRALHFISD